MSTIIEGLSIFKGLTKKDFEKLESIIEEKNFSDGHVLFRQGEETNAFYVIKTGSVRIVIHQNDQDKELAVLSEGDFFGEMGVIENSPRMADALISGETVLLEIEKLEFHQFMALNPTISMKIMSTMVKRYKVKPSQTGASSKDDVEGKIIGLFSATGGVGNSLITANLAAAIRDLTDKRVLVMDLDLMFGDQSGIFDVKSKRSLALLIDETELNYDLVKDCIDQTSYGVDLIQSPYRPEEAEAVTPALILTCLEILKTRYDFILCDTANIIQEFNLNLIDVVDEPIYLLSPEFLSVKNARRWLSVMDMISYPTERVSLLVNKKQENDATLIETIESQLKKKVFGIIPYDYTSAKDSLNKGKLLVNSSPDALITQRLQEVAAKIAGVEIEEKEEQPFWKKWIGGS